MHTPLSHHTQFFKVEQQRMILVKIPINLSKSTHLLGTVAAAWVVWNSIQFISRYFAPRASLRSKYAGTWAIVTGGTGGIGLSIAEELAAEGINIIFVARNIFRLKSTVVEFSESYPEIQTKIISLDASNPDFNAMKSIMTGELDVSLLINNVGSINLIPADIYDLESSTIEDIISVNCLFQVKLTSLIVPLLRNYAQTELAHERGSIPTIVNISSMTSQMAMPLLGVYGASKAFIDHWSLSLRSELQPDINVVCLRPGLTATAMSGESPSLICPTAESMGSACARCILLSSGAPIVPYWPQLIFDLMNALLPQDFSASFTKKMHIKKRMELTSNHKEKDDRQYED
jgi:17beta-estradiol 17-dehydrogenase / very-long-chain 3-oxoacyl-CoA reductase